MEKVKACPRCGSIRVWKTGYRPTVKTGKKQRFVCAECGHSFYLP